MTKSVAALGTGLTGSGVASSLLRVGPDVGVWNRTAGKARTLAGAGATVAADIMSTVSDMDVVVTMRDGDFTPSVSTEGAALRSLFDTTAQTGYGNEDLASDVRAFHA